MATEGATPTTPRGVAVGIAGVGVGVGVGVGGTGVAVAVGNGVGTGVGSVSPLPHAIVRLKAIATKTMRAVFDRISFRIFVASDSVDYWLNV